MKRKPFQSKLEILFSGENDGMGFLVIIRHINTMHERMKNPCVNGPGFRRNRKKSSAGGNLFSDRRTPVQSCKINFFLIIYSCRRDRI